MAAPSLPTKEGTTSQQTSHSEKKTCILTKAILPSRKFSGGCRG